jgi:hypothetical protein
MASAGALGALESAVWADEVAFASAGTLGALSVVWAVAGSCAVETGCANAAIGEAADPAACTSPNPESRVTCPAVAWAVTDGCPPEVCSDGLVGVDMLGAMEADGAAVPGVPDDGRDSPSLENAPAVAAAGGAPVEPLLSAGSEFFCR